MIEEKKDGDFLSLIDVEFIHSQLKKHYQDTEKDYCATLEVGEEKYSIPVNKLFVNLVIVEDMTQQLHYQQQYREHAYYSDAESNETKEASAPTRPPTSLAAGYEQGMRLLNTIQTAKRDIDQDMGILFDGEGIYAQKHRIDPKALFYSQTLTNGHAIESPKKILLLGRAGIGKSILCRYLTQQWSTGCLWRGEFKWVFFFRLKEVANFFKRKPAENVTHILHEMLLRRCGVNSREAADFFWAQLLASQEKILFILDGYDEVVSKGAHGESDKSAEMLMAMTRDYGQYHQLHLLITSRPYVQIAHDVDIIFENIGFLDEDINQYIDRYFNFYQSLLQKQPVDAEALKRWIQQRPKIKQMCHIPINIEFICSIWVTHSHQLSQEDIVMSDLYKHITAKLLKRYLQHKVYDYTQHHLVEGDISRLFHDVHALKTLSFLEKVAFEGLKTGNLILDHDILTDVQKEQGLSGSDLASYVSSGFLNSIGEDYYFIHLSFQEYFTARYFALKIIHQELSEADKAFMFLHRYNPAYQLVWTYVPGVIQTYDGLPVAHASQIVDWSIIKQQAISYYFSDFLLAGNRDLYGMYEFELLVRCGEETKWPNYSILQSLLEHLGRQVMSIARVSDEKTKTYLFKHLTQLFLSCPIAMGKIHYRGEVGLINFMSKQAAIPRWSKRLEELNRNLWISGFSSKDLMEQRGFGSFYPRMLGRIGAFLAPIVKAVTLSPSHDDKFANIALFVGFLAFPAGLIGLAILAIVSFFTESNELGNAFSPIAKSYEETLGVVCKPLSRAGKYCINVSNLPRRIAVLMNAVLFLIFCFLGLLVGIPYLFFLPFYLVAMASLLPVGLIAGLFSIFYISSCLFLVLMSRILEKIPFVLINGFMGLFSLLNYFYCYPFFKLKKDNMLLFLAQFRFEDIAQTRRLLALIAGAESSSCLRIINAINTVSFTSEMLEFLCITLRNRLVMDVNLFVQFSCYQKLKQAGALSYEEQVVIINAVLIQLAHYYERAIVPYHRIKQVKKLFDGVADHEMLGFIEGVAKFLAKRPVMLRSIENNQCHAVALLLQLLPKISDDSLVGEYSEITTAAKKILVWQIDRIESSDELSLSIYQSIIGPQGGTNSVVSSLRGMLEEDPQVNTNRAHREYEVIRSQDQSDGSSELIDRYVESLRNSSLAINAQIVVIRALVNMADYQGKEEAVFLAALVSLKMLIEKNRFREFFIPFLVQFFSFLLCMPTFTSWFVEVPSFLNPMVIFGYCIFLPVLLACIPFWLDIGVLCFSDYLLIIGRAENTASFLKGMQLWFLTLFFVFFPYLFFSGLFLPFSLLSFISLMAFGLVVDLILLFSKDDIVTEVLLIYWGNLSDSCFSFIVNFFNKDFFFDWLINKSYRYNFYLLVSLFEKSDFFLSLLKHYPRFYQSEKEGIFITLLRDRMQEYATAIWQDKDGTFHWYQGRKLVSFTCDNPSALVRDLGRVQPLQGRFSGDSIWSSWMSCFWHADAPEEEEPFQVENRYRSYWEDGLRQLETIADPVDDPTTETASSTEDPVRRWFSIER